MNPMAFFIARSSSSSSAGSSRDMGVGFDGVEVAAAAVAAAFESVEGLIGAVVVGMDCAGALSAGVDVDVGFGGA